MEEEESNQQAQLKINADTKIEQIINMAKKKKKNAKYKPTSKKEKLASIRDNRAIEKEANRAEEKFDLDSNIIQQNTEVIEFTSTNKYEEQTVTKPSSRLLEKIKRKRDEEYGKEE